MQYKVFLLFIVFTWITQTSWAQESINSSGGEAQGTGGNISFSIGQTFFQELNSSPFTMNEGVQQPNYQVITGTTANESIPRVKVFPNPTSHSLRVELPPTVDRSLAWHIVDMAGKKRYSENTDLVATLDLSKLDQGVYFLLVTLENEELQRIKIIKN